MRLLLLLLMVQSRWGMVMLLLLLKLVVVLVLLLDLVLLLMHLMLLLLLLLQHQLVKYCCAQNVEAHVSSWSIVMRDIQIVAMDLRRRVARRNVGQRVWHLTQDLCEFVGHFDSMAIHNLDEPLELEILWFQGHFVEGHIGRQEKTVVWKTWEFGIYLGLI